MSKLVEFDVPGKGTVLIEVNDPYSSELTPAANPGEVVITKAKKTFDQALDGLNPMFESIKEKLDEIEPLPNEVELKFGIKLSAQVGAVVTGGGEASYEITLKWKNE